MKFKHKALLMTLIILWGSCAEDSFTEVGPTIIDGVRSDSDLTTLTQAIDKANLESALDGTQYTLFAPTNQAFSNAGINLSTIDADSLLEILKYHVIKTRTDSSRLDVPYGIFQGQILPATGANFPSQNYLGGLTYLGVNTMNLGVNANIYYTQAIEVIDNATPTLSLRGFFVNGAQVTEFDAFEGSDGVVHKIDRVLLPPVGSAKVALEVDPDLSLFNKLVKKASTNTTTGIPSFALAVLDILPANATATTRAGTLTILAPNDAAMIAAGYTSSAIDGLTIQNCLDIARRHVIGARWFSSDLFNQLFRVNPAVTTLSVGTQQTGFNVVYNNNGTSVFFSSTNTPTASIVSPDIVITNGVMHKLDRVLLP